MFSFDQILDEISKKTDNSKDELRKMVEEKQDELSGLVSPEGAAYIVGKELGVTLLKETKRDLKISSVIPGMRSVDLTVRILQIFEPRDFEKNGKKGSVSNILIGDGTATIRFSLWNDDIGLIRDLGISEGDIIKVSGGFVKEDNRGNLELRLGKTGKIEKLDEKDADIPKDMNVTQAEQSVRKKDIYDFNEGDLNETRATIVQIYKRSPFYEVCPECNSRIERRDDGWYCREHGKVEPKYNIVISGVIDDGTGNIRSVFFREVAEQVIGERSEKLKDLYLGNPVEMYDKVDVVGKEFIFTGRVKMNSFTERLEFVVDEVREADVKKEASNLLEKMKK